MKRISDKAYTRMFLFAALWNISLSVPCILFPKLILTMIFGPEMDQSLILGNFYASTYFFSFWVAIFLFGLGYYFVSRDITKNHGIIWMGICGKIPVFFFYTYSYFTGRTSLFSFLGGIGDFVFTILFLIFLWQTRTGE